MRSLAEFLDFMRIYATNEDPFRNIKVKRDLQETLEMNYLYV